MCVGSTVTPLAVMQVKINQFPFRSYLLGTLSHVLASLTQTQLLSDMLSECHHSRENEQRLICHDFFLSSLGIHLLIRGISQVKKNMNLLIHVLLLISETVR